MGTQEIDFGPFVRMSQLGHELIEQARQGTVGIKTRAQIRQVRDEVQEQREERLLHWLEDNFG
jgi:hypothetical protein